MNSVNGPFLDPFFCSLFCRKSKTAIALHFVVSLSEKRRVAHRETTYLLLQKDELLKKYPFYFGSSEKLLIFALGEINFQENEKIRDC